MTLPPDRERVRQILSETIGLLCRNGLSFDFALSVDALIGITIDHKDVFLVSIKDTYDSERNLQKPYGCNSVVAKQILNDSGQKDGCSKLDSTVMNNFLPSSVANDNWSRTEDQLSFAKKTTPNNFISTQSYCKRMIERSECLGDHTKRARISENTDAAAASQTTPMLLTIVKTEPSDDMMAAKASDTTTSCATSPSFDTSCGHCSSGSVSMVNSNLKNNRDSEHVETLVPSCNEESIDHVPNASGLAKESNSRSPSNCLHQDASNEASSQLSSDCNDGGSSFEKQNSSKAASSCPAANSNTEKQSSRLPSNIHVGNYSLATRYNVQAPSVSHSGNSNGEKQANSETSSDSLTFEDTPDKTKSRTSIHQRRSNHTVYDLHVESASSDSEVICIKEEIPYLPFKSCGSFAADPAPSSLQNNGARSKEAALALSSVDSLNLESLSYDHSIGWKGLQNSFYHHVRRQQKDAWNTWNQDNVMSPAFEDTRSLEKQLTQAAQAILLYDGQYVPLRDIQRLRLCGMAAGQIKMAMEQLSSYDGKLGCFQMLHGGVNLFYKCPPNLVDREILESNYCIPWETYKFHYNVTPASNITTKHNEQYWLKVASSSPYNSSNQSLHIA